MTWIAITNKRVDAGCLDDLDAKMKFLELDGYDVDFNVLYMDDHASMEVEVYVNETLVGMAHHFDDIEYIVDSYWDERVDS